MKYNNKQQAVLLLKDGTIFYGKSIGISGTTFGEIAFNTGTTGYQEIFTDPSYYGQIMVTTNAHIGNYGVNTKEVESDSVKISGLVCKNFSMNYSREDASESLYDYLEKQNLIVISDVDTRALVSYIRDNGAMNAIISTDGTSIEDLKVLLGRARAKKGMFEGDLVEGELEIGQIAGLIHNIKSVESIINEVIQEFQMVSKDIQDFKF
jgi:carbamoyl-phosphate synthase small subunit